MSLELATTLIAAILLAGLIVRRWSENKRKKLANSAATTSASSEDDSLLDLNEKFLRLAADTTGPDRTQVKLVRSFSPADSAMLRSILDAEGIPSYCDANSMGSLYAGVAIEGISDEIILVFEADREAAYQIAGEFIQELQAGPGTARSLPELIEN